MVAQELECIPGEPVGARLGHGVDRRRRLEAVLRGEAARRDAELLEGIRERQREVHVLLRVVVRRAVERVPDAGLEAAGHRDLHTARQHAGCRRTGLHRSPREHEQVGDLTPLERQLDDPPFSTTELIPALRTSTIGAAASTVTVSSSEPGPRAAFTVGVAPTVNTSPVCT